MTPRGARLAIFRGVVAGQCLFQARELEDHAAFRRLAVATLQHLGLITAYQQAPTVSLEGRRGQLLVHLVALALRDLDRGDPVSLGHVALRRLLFVLWYAKTSGKTSLLPTDWTTP